MNRNILVVYFSKPGSNYYKGSIIKLDTGNTEKCAKYIEDEFDADIFRVERLDDYKDDYNLCMEEAGVEFKQDIHPKLLDHIDSIDQYETIVIAYPNWYNTMPMPMFTFLESLDFSSKVILPLCTNEGSGLGNSVKDIKILCPHADVRQGLSIKGSEVDNLHKEIINWINTER